MVKNNLNYPATYVHTVNGKRYKMDGILTSINESTCTMKFKNGRVINNISTKEIYLNENFIDDIKAKGLQAVNAIKDVIKTVKGFILPITEKGKELLQFINIPLNVACMRLPESIKFAPSQATIDVADAMGCRVRNNNDIDSIFAEAEARESEEGNRFFKRLMREYVANESMSFVDTYKLVQEKYYRDTITGKKANTLNEAYGTISLRNVMPDHYGMEISGEALVDRIQAHLLRQLKNMDFKKDKPLLIWGAPGIGKTTIIKQAAKLLAGEYDRDGELINLDMVTLACAGIRRDDMSLPASAQNILGNEMAAYIPQTWLPVYDPNKLSNAELKMTDDFYNASAHKIFKVANLDKKRFEDEKDGEKVTRNTFEIDSASSESLMERLRNWQKENKMQSYTGGIIFFDEYSRLRQDIFQIMMNLMGDRVYQNMVLASKWLTIGASNRLQDEFKSEEDDEFYKAWGGAALDRFTMYTYVPTKDEWLKWARDVNPKSGRQNIDNIILKFIELAPTSVWYSTLGNGAADETAPGMKALVTATQSKDWKTVSDAINDKATIAELLKLRTCTSRTWDEKINERFIGELETGLFGDRPDLFRSIFDKTKQTRKVTEVEFEDYEAENINEDKLKAALEQVSEKRWWRWVNGKLENINPNYTGGSDLDDLAADEARRRAKIEGTASNDTDPKQYGRNLAATDRLGFIKQWLGNIIIAEATGGRDTVASKEWKKYINITSVLDDREIKSIWEEGQLTRIKQKYDNITYDPSKILNYNNVQHMGWKSDTRAIHEVFEDIIMHNPYDFIKELTADLDVLDKATMPTAKEYEEIKSRYNIVLSKVKDEDVQPTNDNCVKETVNFIFDEETEDMETLLSLARIVNNSIVASQLARVCSYIAKIAVQTGRGDDAKWAMEVLNNKIIDIISTHKNMKTFFKSDQSKKQKGNTIDNDPLTILLTIKASMENYERLPWNADVA